MIASPEKTVFSLAVLGLALSLGACSAGELGDEAIERCVPAGACDEAMFQGGLTAARGVAEQGQQTWMRECSRCHGADGVGIAEARLIDMSSPAWQLSLRDGTLVKTIRAGRAPIMPAYTFSDDELRDLLAFIRSLKADGPRQRQGAEPAPGTRGGY